jgi:ABC-type transporter Mla MlaB component
MLRITLENAANAATFRLEGKLTGPWVDEFARSWHDFRDRAPSTPLTVDLCKVSFIDSEGKKLLRQVFQQGAELRARLMTKYVVDEVVGQRDGNGG